jgi:hypothetical protein
LIKEVDVSNSKMPPVPPAGRSPKGAGSQPVVDRDTRPGKHPPENPDQGDKTAQANIQQNTVNQGYKQDR